MAEKETPKEKKQIDHHIFNGSIALIAVCITVISLFRVTKTGTETFADEVMGFATIIFIAAALLSYLSLRKSSHVKLERAADICFFAGLLLTLVTLTLILFKA